MPDLLHGPERTGAGGPEGDAGQADLLGGSQDGVDVGDEEAVAARRGELGQHELLEVRDHGADEAREVSEMHALGQPRRLVMTMLSRYPFLSCPASACIYSDCYFI